MDGRSRASRRQGAARLSARAALIFGTPLIADRIGDVAADAALVEMILAKKASDPGLVRSNISGWHSDWNLARWGGPGIERILLQVVALAAQQTTGMNKEHRWRIEAWANVIAAGHANVAHAHPANYWSAVYYPRVDAGEGGEIVLHDPRMPARAMHAPQLGFAAAKDEPELRIKPETGLLLMFPSWLSHSVNPWTGEGLRISIGINLASDRNV